ncbi:5-formyltetrahydrofolate cyclo-ligase [Rhodobacteraceae bacterium 2CG4]|uniref:5-formyltetrahydrofolate cyclo-ligase n=2 Tax=Halovulum marinum TaxID=2662447 RepID=A0A6L5Z1U9_9RHOB|nr:5-formyltetrahydrofolate cyclo-ligase [Halovulum marinum]
MAAEVAPGYFDPLAVDPEQARDVARWRTAERQRLLAARGAMSASGRRGLADALAARLEAVLSAEAGPLRGRILSAYWPIRNEPDLRPLMIRLLAAGADVALPVAARPAAPLQFRRWTSDTRLERGVWNIPVPPADAPALTPQIVLAPLVGWDGAGYRLGNGGGYFDRTLAVLDPRPLVIGVGFEDARLPTIFPQPHDVPMDLIVTEAGVRVRRAG